MRVLPTIILGVCLCTNVPGAVASDFAAGAQAYDGGRYAGAFAAWHALAAKGEVRAQIAIAGMYRFGEGRDADFAKAALWYGRAARAGDPIAQLNYAELLEHGYGVARDIAAARYWYGLAAAQGNAWAAAQRRRLGKRVR
jgi:TPR repeat protein